MEEEKKTKSRYTESQHKAINKYRSNRATIEINLTKEDKEKIKHAATEAGQSVNQYIIDKVLKGL